MNSPYRKIIHIDMDAFYASVEQRDQREWRNKPLVVGHDNERSVVSAASYEARRYGIHSAMSIAKAKALCHDLIIAPPRMDVYKHVSQAVHSIFHDYTDLIEPLSLDEAFLDVTHNKKQMDLAVEIAKEIKIRIKQELDLVASAGVSYNKFLAKVASDYRKPNGLCTIHPLQALQFIDTLPIKAFWGVGKVTARKMEELGIHNGKELRDKGLNFLLHHFGKAGVLYYNFARGIDHRPVESNRIRKSIGCEHTLEKDICTKASMIIELYHVAVELEERMKRHNTSGHTLTLKIKFHDFSTVTRSISSTTAIASLQALLRLGKELLKEIDYTHHPVRLIGLSVSHLSDNMQLQLDL
ncbi:MAG: DNA polymerase IV [Bacteroidetes bacterium]|uniref:DNA polymerase IV n=1 Tax=Candidatus Gallipaludibacter merdavium TaxID=2840839 RepID=A0A9D9HUW3_9BACT|nr:DNA polymerase IV [Candidatus Gallipaludibacter merdavium]